ncbi:YopX family protein [Persephonella sp.]|uniref:YopX family protein n=1 Tax=Persephonella sp. TaxID=2060922 RepID=UPI00260CAC06|nr:YopX family protein [Persephonella sp.]
MRQIKFRAFIEPLNSMIQVSKLTLATSGDVMVWINDTFYFDGHEAHLMQYTGLKDKNGKEIYEGDIVRVNIDELPPYTTVGQIVYSAPAFALKNKSGALESLELLIMNYAPEKVLEVIGNIYENPELLEENNV